MKLRLLLIGGSVVAGLLGLYKLTYVPLRCNQRLTELQRSTSAIFTTRRNFRTIALARNNIDELEALHRHCPSEVDVVLALAVNYRLVGRRDDAIRMYQKALHHAQRPEIYLNLGLTQLEALQRDNAIPNLVRAVRYHAGYLDDIHDESVKDLVAAEALSRR